MRLVRLTTSLHRCTVDVGFAQARPNYVSTWPCRAEVRSRAEAAVGETESLAEEGSEDVSMEQDFCVESILVCVCVCVCVCTAHVWPAA